MNLSKFLQQTGEALLKAEIRREQKRQERIKAGEIIPLVDLFFNPAVRDRYKDTPIRYDWSPNE